MECIRQIPTIYDLIGDAAGGYDTFRAAEAIEWLRGDYASQQVRDALTQMVKRHRSLKRVGRGLYVWVTKEARMQTKHPEFYDEVYAGIYDTCGEEEWDIAWLKEWWPHKPIGTFRNIVDKGLCLGTIRRVRRGIYQFVPYEEM